MKHRKTIPFAFNSPIACRIANMHTKRIERFERAVFGTVTPYNTRFAKPLKANWANDLAERLEKAPDKREYAMQALEAGELWTKEYESTKRPGQPLAHFINIAGNVPVPAPSNNPSPNKGTEPVTAQDQDQAAVAAIVDEAKQEPKATNTGATSAPHKGNTDTANKLAEALAEMLAGQTPKAAPLDESRIRDIAREEAAKINTPKPTVVHIARTDQTGKTVTKDLGLQHFKFAVLLKLCQLRQADGYVKPVWMPGPAGSGKTTAAMHVAKALDIPFHHNGAIDTDYKLTGYQDGGGLYHSTEFRAAYETGGVYLFDEVDASNPNALVALNAALENGHCPFPDKTIARHKDCIVLAAANTYGMGATHEYVGRNKIDAATVDRFIMLDWPYDETLERALTGNDEWVNKVQAYRAKAKRAGIKHVISPRASIIGAALLDDGFSESDVINMVVRKGLSDDNWASIR